MHFFSFNKLISWFAVFFYDILNTILYLHAYEVQCFFIYLIIRISNYFKLIDVMFLNIHLQLFHCDLFIKISD